MANNVSFNSTRINSRSVSYLCTLAAGDTDTAILVVEPDSLVSIFIDVGTSETVALEATNKANVPDDVITSADMQIIKPAITSDFDDFFTGPVTAIQVTGTIAANETLVRVLEVKQPR